MRIALLLLLLCMTSNLFARTFTAKSPALRRQAAAEQLELISDIPKRAHRILSPLSASHTDGQQACNAITLQAVQLGADAIIEVKLTTGTAKEAYSQGLLLPGAATTQPQAICTGTAIQWK